MLFVDGENFTIRGQEFASHSGLKLIAGPYWRKDVFLWAPGRSPRAALANIDTWGTLAPAAVRAHYYTSVVGDDPLIEEVREQLWTIGFDPHVFKREKTGQKSKGVDIALATDVLSHAFQNHYEMAVLVAGDGDYAPLVREVKRLGKVVTVMSIGSGLSPKLRLAADDCIYGEPWLAAAWLANVGEAPAHAEPGRQEPAQEQATPAELGSDGR